MLMPMASLRVSSWLVQSMTFTIGHAFQGQDANDGTWRHLSTIRRRAFSIGANMAFRVQPGGRCTFEKQKIQID